MNTKAILMAAAFFSLTVSFTAGAQDDTAAAGVSRVELLATASNIVNQPIAYPAGAAKVTAEGAVDMNNWQETVVTSSGFRSSRR